VIQHCPLLEEFTVTGRACSNAFVLELAKRCKALKRVSLTQPSLEEESLLALIHSNPGLVDFAINAHGATENFLQNLALTCKGLTKLSLDSIGVLPQTALFFILKHCACLESIYVEYCQFQEVETVTDAAVKSTSLRELTLNSASITVDALEDLLEACPGLTSLTIANCEDVYGLDDVPIGAYCHALETLVVRDNPGVAAGDEIMESLIEHCPHLRVLHIPGSFFESEDILPDLARQCLLLQELDIDKSGGVMDDALLALAQHCRDLKVLRLTRCEAITDVGVTAVMETCAGLEQLAVRKCKKVSKKLKDTVEARYPKTL
jgi:hypothetical protein